MASVEMRMLALHTLKILNLKMADFCEQCVPRSIRTRLEEILKRTMEQFKAERCIDLRHRIRRR